MYNLEEKHIKNPLSGDYWHEPHRQSTPVCVVLEVFMGHVIFCDKTIPLGLEKGWTWDLEKRSAKSLEEFKKWLSYGTIPGCYWARVAPEAHKEILNFC